MASLASSVSDTIRAGDLASDLPGDLSPATEAGGEAVGYWVGGRVTK